MATKYRYKLGESDIETMVLSEVPQGVNYETIDFEIEVFNKLVPLEVAFWRIIIILKLENLEQPIKEAIPNLPEPTKMMVSYIWDNNVNITVERQSKTVSFFQSVLQLTDEEVDEIFIKAFNIKI